MQQKEEKSAPICSPGYESIQSNSHPSQFLDLFGISRWLQAVNGFNLIRVHLNSPMSHHVAQKFSQTYSKRTFGCVQMQLMLPQNFEDVCEVSHMLGHYLTLYNHIINIDFNTSSELWFEHFSHHPLIKWSNKRHHFIMIVSNGSNKNCLFLIV